MFSWQASQGSLHVGLRDIPGSCPEALLPRAIFAISRPDTQYPGDPKEGDASVEGLSLASSEKRGHWRMGGRIFSNESIPLRFFG
jgi:hypothetical protein